MCKWVETNRWKAFKDIFVLVKDILMVVIAAVVLLKGTNILDKQNEMLKTQDERIEGNKLSVRFLKNQVEDQIGKTTAPVTEQKPDSNDGVLSRHNVTLADSETQIAQVQEWLTNPYSGYPALAEAIRRVIGNNKLVGNAVPLTIINARNLKAHGHGTESPIISSAAIDDARLKDAIYASWAEKNAGSLSNHKSFQDIVVPVQ